MNDYSLLDLISQNQPDFQTHQALVVIGLQNDFIQPDGKLPVETQNGFLDRIRKIVPKFRQLSASVIWIQTVYQSDLTPNDPTLGDGDAHAMTGLLDLSTEGNYISSDDDEDLPQEPIPPTQPKSSRRQVQRALELLKRVSARRRTTPRAGPSQPAAEEDEELFLLQAARNGVACLPNTPGADFVEPIQPLIELSDNIVRTSNYSAFQNTSLLQILRAKLVTEVFICGCITNVSVLATVIDAAKHGIKINVVEDCLGFRKQSRHDEALQKMVGFFNAKTVTSKQILNRDLSDSATSHQRKPGSRKVSQPADTDKLPHRVGALRSSDDVDTHQALSSKMPYPSLASPMNGRPRTLSDASIAESRATTDTKLSDEQFAEKLSQGARIRDGTGEGQDPPPPVAKRQLVKSKVVMRPRRDKVKKDDEKDKLDKSDKKKQRPESSKNGAEAQNKPQASTSASVSSTTEPVPATTTAEPTPDPTGNSPKDAQPPPVEPPPRLPIIVKAESSDRLRESPSRQQKLKSSVSQPSLPHATLEVKDKSSPSRVRLALSKGSKSESTKPEQPQPQKSPTKLPVESEEAKTTPPDSIKSSKMSKKLQSLATFATLGPGDKIAEGDSHIIYDFFPPEFEHPTDRSKPLKDLIFQQLYNEVCWQKMHHQQGEVPRLVCCQGEFGADGSMPVYRHPTDQALPLLHFSPKVKVIQKQAEKLVGHPLNHVLIQLYRSGQDYISEHSDKTLDIVRGSSIVNVSFGAQRTMRLRTKKSANNEVSEAGSRTTERVAMPHNSMFVLGLETNKKWLHGINADKRLPLERSDEEKAYSGMRISLTFRHIGTFLDADSSRIWGQGATSKNNRDAQDVINDDEDETEKMVRAFSKENHESEFDWDEHYGSGFDVLHFRQPPEDIPILFASHNRVETKMVQIFLWESKLNHLLSDIPIYEPQYESDRQVCYRDNDVNHTEVIIAVPILLYLDHYHPLDRDDRGRSCSSRSYETFVLISTILKCWNNRLRPDTGPVHYKNFVNMLESLEERCALGLGPFIAGRRFSIGDCAAWPAIDEIIATWDGWSEERFPCLTEYYKMLWRKKGSVKKLRTELPKIEKEHVA